MEQKTRSLCFTKDMNGLMTKREVSLEYAFSNLSMSHTNNSRSIPWFGCNDHVPFEPYQTNPYTEFSTGHIWSGQETQNRSVHGVLSRKDSNFSSPVWSQDTVQHGGLVSRFPGPSEPHGFNPNQFSPIAPRLSSTADYNANAGCSNYSGRGSSSSSTSSRRAPHWLQDPMNYLSMEEWGGDIIKLAKDQYGSKSLGRTIGCGDREQIDMLFRKLIDHVCDLMVDPFGSYVVQKLVNVCNERQRSQVLIFITKNKFQLVHICLNVYGTRVVQQLLSYISNPQEVSLLIRALSSAAVALTNNSNGHHIILFCLNHFRNEDTTPFLHEVAANCFGIATHKVGCCIIQNCITSSQGQTRDYLVSDIIVNALLLAQHDFGNYVLQHVLELKEPRYTADILSQLEGSYMLLSLSKCGSNVVQACLKESTEDQSTQIIVELLNSPDFDTLFYDQYGNYVIQTAVSVSKGLVQSFLLRRLKVNVPNMRNNRFGKLLLGSLQKNGYNYRLL